MIAKLWIEDDHGLRPLTDEILQEVVADLFAGYIIPANELDRRAQLMAIRLGMPVPELQEVRTEMATNWAALLIRQIHERLSS